MGSPWKKQKAPSRGLGAGFRNRGALCRNYKARLGTEQARALRMLIAREEEAKKASMMLNIVDGLNFRSQTLGNEPESSG